MFGDHTLLIIVIAWLAISVAVGAIAESKGRSFGGWCLLALIVSPLLAGLALALVGDDKKALEKLSLELGEQKKCPYCAELIRQEATICRFCGRDQPQQQPQQMQPVGGFWMLRELAVVALIVSGFSFLIWLLFQIEVLRW